jgi:uncharacterized damage-inducible protein DinB
MDILDRYLGYETWTLRHLISRCRAFTAAQLHQPFDVGPGSLHKTLDHVIRNIEVWTDLMRGSEVRNLPPLGEGAGQSGANVVDEYLTRFDNAMADFSALARALAAQNRLDDTYMDVLDNPPQPKTFGGTLLHVLTHTSVHRWEMQHMMQRLGIEDLIEGDALSWEWRLQQGEL